MSKRELLVIVVAFLFAIAGYRAQRRRRKNLAVVLTATAGACGVLSYIVGVVDGLFPSFDFLSVTVLGASLRMMASPLWLPDEMARKGQWERPPLPPERRRPRPPSRRDRKREAGGDEPAEQKSLLRRFFHTVYGLLQFVHQLLLWSSPGS